MARPSHLFVVCYDVAKDSLRNRLATFLEARLVRVQRSVFEGRMTRVEARALARHAATFLEADDSLRVYCITEAGRRASHVHGPAPLPEAEDFWLL